MTEIALPFLKWVGGKRWLLSTIESLLPPKWNVYHEPFLGGGAVFFGISPERAMISDKNRELINAYIQVRNNVEALIPKLRRKHISKEYFYDIRSRSFNDQLKQAVRLIYLNKTAFNGLYRVNRRGDFNVPFGCKPNTQLCENALLRKAAERLKSATLGCMDFEDALQKVRTGDLVYLDPPYTVTHNNNGFRRYNEAIFTWDDQLRLAQSVKKVITKGAFVILSNAYHSEVINLYKDIPFLSVSRHSNLSARSEYRGRVTEVLFVSNNLLSICTAKQKENLGIRFRDQNEPPDSTHTT